MKRENWFGLILHFNFTTQASPIRPVITKRALVCVNSRPASYRSFLPRYPSTARALSCCDLISNECLKQQLLLYCCPYMSKYAWQMGCRYITIRCKTVAVLIQQGRMAFCQIVSAYGNISVFTVCTNTGIAFLQCMSTHWPPTEMLRVSDGKGFNIGLEMSWGYLLKSWQWRHRRIHFLSARSQKHVSLNVWFKHCVWCLN
jgi:hypothetical protein